MIDFIKKMLGFGPAPTTPGALAQPWPFPVSQPPQSHVRVEEAPAAPVAAVAEPEVEPKKAPAKKPRKTAAKKAAKKVAK
jgi:hypothetical protein